MPELALRIGGHEIIAWQDVRVSLSMQTLCGDFELTVTDAPEFYRPQPGDDCQVLADGEVVITGHVDALQVSYSGTSHRMTVSGRDATGDLVDCAAPPQQFNGRSLTQLAQALCAPYHIEVVDKVKDDYRFGKLKANDGESVFEFLEQAARQRGVLLRTDGQGRLVIDRAGTERATDALSLGGNILSGSGGVDLREVFRDYTVKGSRPGDDNTGPDDCVVLCRYRDEGIRRHRPCVVMADGETSLHTAKDRARWEASVRRGRGERATYTLAGWRQSDGALWRINQRVQVTDPWIGIDGERLIADVSYSLGADGARTELTVMPVAAFEHVKPTQQSHRRRHGVATDA